MKTKTPSIVFLWENFGPMHADRCDAVASTGAEVTGLELYSRSDTYDWVPEAGKLFNKITLFLSKPHRGLILLFKLILFRLRHKKSTWFLCHYDWTEILLFAWFLRLCGDQVFTMGCSKFDDKPRNSLREALKPFFFLPYQGALGSGLRSRDFFRFQGFKAGQVAGEYNTLSLQRVRDQAGVCPAPNGVEFAQRHFTIIARFVSKKNLEMALQAYALYTKLDPNPRPLYLCGDGPLADKLKNTADQLGVTHQVKFEGFIQAEAIAKKLGTSLALILPSIEEQFGNVVIEAQAMGLPVLLTDACGASDHLVRTGVNGFVFEPDNPDGLAWFMMLVATDTKLWSRMCENAIKTAPKGDVSSFVDGVITLISVKNNERNNKTSNP